MMYWNSSYIELQPLNDLIDNIFANWTAKSNYEAHVSTLSFPDHIMQIPFTSVCSNKPSTGSTNKNHEICIISIRASAG